MPGPSSSIRLSEQQRAAVEHRAGPLIVLAGPGSGKTVVLTERIRSLIEEGADPSSVLALTFGVKAAQEVRERIALALGAGPAERIQAYTFHGYGLRIVQRFGDMIGLRYSPEIMDSAQTRRILRSLIRRHGLYKDYEAAGHEGVIGTARKFIEACRHAGKPPLETLAYARSRLDRANAAGQQTAESRAELARASLFHEHARLYAAFDDACIERGLLTYEDFITLPARILSRKPVAADILRSEIRHVLVDEFQDVNAAQANLLRLLAPPAPDTDICVVGDDDQAIYAFRGADTRAFQRFAEVWTDHTVVELGENHRCAGEVVRVSAAIIARAGNRFRPEKRLFARSDAPPGLVEGVLVRDNADEGRTIAAMIIADRRRRPDRRLTDYCVIARTRDTRDQIASELNLAGVPSDSGLVLTPLSDPGVQDVLRWIELIVNPAADAACVRLLTRPPYAFDIELINGWRRAYERAAADGETGGFVAWAVRRHGPDHPLLSAFAALLKELRTSAESEPADRIVERIIRETAVAVSDNLPPRERAKRISNLARMIGFVRSCQPRLDPPGNLAEFNAYYDDLDDDEKAFRAPSHADLDGGAETEAGDEPERVSVITAHAAKGLQFDTVFIARVRPRGFPTTERADRNDAEPLPEEFTGTPGEEHHDEERRLFYVACTRAKRRLVLLAKEKKSVTAAIDYFDELTRLARSDPIPVRDASEHLEEAGMTPPDELERMIDEAAGPHRADAVVRRAFRALRQRIFNALHDAENTRPADPDAPAALASVQERLARSAATMAALAHLRDTGSPPEPPVPGADEGFIATVAGQLRAAAGSTPHRVPSPPLSLSFSSVHAYIQCPRCYYLQYIEGIAPPVSDELSIGSVAHDAIADFLREVRSAEADGAPPPGTDRLLAIASARYRAAWPPSRPYSEESLATIHAQLRLMMETMHDDANILEIERTVRFPYTVDGVEHRFTAKLDRLDQLADGRLRIVDYKTGRAWKKLTEPANDDLQLCIYTMALPVLLGGDGGPDPGPLPPGTAEYWVLAEGKKGVVDLSDLRLDKARRKIDQAVRGMLAGRFEKGKDCRSGHCDWLEGLL